jgi:hypothetical protein
MNYVLENVHPRPGARPCTCGEAGLIYRPEIWEWRALLHAKYEAFFALLERDAGDSPAALELGLAQPTMSSQFIHNLNASFHLRALLTDVFRLTQVLTGRLRADPLVAS